MPESIFATDRLEARRLGPADVDAMVAVYGDAAVVRWVDDGTPLDRAGCARWIDITLANYTNRGYGMVALVERSTGEVVGFCGLVHPGGQAQAEIKYALRRDQWGKGYATEAARGLLAYGATVLGLTEVIATADPENTASHHVLVKAGLQRDRLETQADGTLTQFFVWRAS